MRVLRSTGMLAVGLLLATCAFAQDWPQWLGTNHDAKVAGFTAPQAWPAAFTNKWQVTVGTGDATPALVGDKLYVFARQGAEEVTLCLNAGDGTEVWRDKIAAPTVTGAAAKHGGPRGMPAVLDGKVVTLGVGGVLSCFDAATGKLLWRKDEFPGIYPRFFSSSSPILVDGLAIAYLGGAGNGALMAFDLTTGEIKWKWAEEGPAYSTPVIQTVGGVKQVVAMTEKSVVGVSLTDGKLHWKVPFPTTGMQYNAATPIVDGDTVIFSGQGRGTKALQIAKDGDKFTTKELWANAATGVQYSTAVLKDGFIYGLSDKGFLFCIDAKTGTTKWTDTIKRGRNFGAIVDAGTVLFILPDNSALIAFAPNSTAYTELAQIKVAATPTYTFPVIAGKRIFVKDQDTLTLWTLE